MGPGSGGLKLLSRDFFETFRVPSNLRIEPPYFQVTLLQLSLFLSCTVLLENSPSALLDGPFSTLNGPLPLNALMSLFHVENRGRKRHINIWHIKNLCHPGHRSSRPGTRFLPAGYPDENVYVPWAPHTARKLLTPGHRSGDPPPTHPVGRPPPARAVTGNIC